MSSPLCCGSHGFESPRAGRASRSERWCSRASGSLRSFERLTPRARTAARSGRAALGALGGVRRRPCPSTYRSARSSIAVKTALARESGCIVSVLRRCASRSAGAQVSWAPAAVQPVPRALNRFFHPAVKQVIGNALVAQCLRLRSALTGRSSGRAQGGFAALGPPLNSNV